MYNFLFCKASLFITEIALVEKKGRKTAVGTCVFKPLVCSESLKFTVRSPYSGGIGREQGAGTQEASGEGEGEHGSFS